MPYRHGFLTKTLREYLKKDRKKVKSKQRAVYDYHIRKILKQVLDDLVFVLGNIDKKEFDKLSSIVRKSLVSLLSVFTKNIVDRSQLKYPWGRIKEYRLKFYTDLVLKGEYPMSVLCDLVQDSLDEIYGQEVVYAHFMTKKAHLDYKEFIRKRGIISF